MKPESEKIIGSRKRITDIAIILIAMVIGSYFGWNIAGVVIFCFFLWIILNPMPSRYLGLGSLLCIMITPILILLERRDQAEQLAVYAYYFLVFAVIMELHENYRLDKKTSLEK